MSEFEELYNSYYKDVYYFVLKLTDYQEHITEEVTQESFYQAFISLKRFRGECSIKSWLCQIAKNTYYKYLRAHAKETSLDEELHLEQEERATSTVVEEKQMIAHIRKVIEHLAECKECTKYYEALGKEMKPAEEQSDKETKYVLLAAKIRKRKKIVALVISTVAIIYGFFCLKYALGYRMDSKAAADLSGRLNFESELLTSFEWKNDFHFYIYDSYSCYDVISVEKTLLGWKMFESCLNWPKWSMYDETIGIETAGDLCHYKYDEGVQIFPVVPYDSNVKAVEVTCFGQTQTKEVEAGKVTLFTFDAISGQTNTVEAYAYDVSGNIIYSYEKQGSIWIWVPVIE